MAASRSTIHPPTSSLARIETQLGLRGYQRETLRSFVDRGGRGIAHLATGTGKTLIGIGAVLWAKAGKQRTLIVVPTRALVHQWKAELLDRGGLRPEQVASVAGSRRLRRVGDAQVVLTPIQTAMRNPDVLEAMVTEQDRSLIIVDECHRAGAPKFSRTLVDAFPFRLGLSATPERDFDPTGTRRVLDYFEGVAHAYDLGQAVADGHLARYTYHLHSTYLNPFEQEQYDEFCRTLNLLLAEVEARFEDPPTMEDLGELLSLLRNEGEEELAEEIQENLFQRARVVKNAAGKVEIFERLVGQMTRKKVIVFSEEIAFSEELARAAKKAGLETFVYHSMLDQAERDAALERFRAIERGVLVAVRALDEGLDVPDADVAVLAASSTSQRQHIQRRGRVLRPLKDAAKSAELHDFYVIGVDDPWRVARIKEDAHRVQIHGFEGGGERPWDHLTPELG